jgi:Flp pilus assembly protein TadD
MFNFDRWRYRTRGWLLHFFGREDAAYAAYVEAFRHDPQDVEAARHLAGIAARRQHWDAAHSWFDKVVAAAPTDAASWFNLGFVCEQSGRSERAVTAFGEAVRLQPSLDRAWYGLGLARARLGEHELAAAAFAESARLQPLNGEAFYQWGMALHHAHRPDELRMVVERLVGFDPKRARRLIQEAERADLLPLIPQMPF